MSDGLDKIASKLAAADRILLTSHRGPDGDGVGSMVALAAILRGLGKRATLHSSDPVPRALKWLPHVKTWTRKLKAESKYQVTVVVDCGDPKLLGPKFPKPEVSGELLVLDHHANARPFGDVFFSDPKAAATGVLVARLAERAGWKLDRDSALGIWVALVSDTGSFRYANTNPEALALASRLVGEHGVDPWMVSERLDERVPLRRYRLLARVLDGIDVVLDDKVAVMVVTQELLDSVKASWQDTDGLINYARAIDTVEVGVLMSPAKWGGTRVSMRSKGRVDVGSLCHGLGGGGHQGAAGCTIEGELPGARDKVLAALGEALGVEPARSDVPEAESAADGPNSGPSGA